MTADEVARVRYAGGKYLSGYSWLAREAHMANRCRWMWRPKLHQFEHLLDSLLEVPYNPRFYWCYPDEDFIGHIVETARAAHPWTMVLRTLQRYRIGLGLAWSGRGVVPHGSPHSTSAPLEK